VNIKELIGLTIYEFKVKEEEILIKTSCGRTFLFYHSQDCCETVYVESVNGDISDLIGKPILIAEESTNSESHPEDFKDEVCEDFTWTFYKLATIKGHVDIRWLGESNGYYSEKVDFKEITQTKENA
jgi:hypothetical protein